MSFNKVLWAIVCTLSLALMAPLSHADVYLNGTAGNDGNAGTTSGAAVQSITTAINILNTQAAGSDLHIMDAASAYAGGNHPITISGTSGDRVSIFGDGVMPTLRSCVFGVTGSWVEFSGVVLECTGVPTGAFKIYNTGTNLNLVGVQIYAENSCIDNTASAGDHIDGLTIRNSWLQAPDGGEFIKFQSGVRCTNLLIDGVGMLRTGTAGGGNEIYIGDLTLAHDNIQILNCNISCPDLTNPNAGTISLGGGPITNVTVENTVVSTAANVAIRFPGLVDGAVIRNCTFSAYWHVVQLYGSTYRNLLIENCSLSLDGTRGSYRNAGVTFEKTWNKQNWTAYGDGSLDCSNVIVRNITCNNGSVGVSLQGEAGGGTRHAFHNMLFENITVNNTSLHVISIHGCEIDDVTFRNFTSTPTFTADMIQVQNCNGSGLWLDNIEGDGSSQGSGNEGIWCPVSSAAPDGLAGFVIQNCSMSNTPYDGINIESGVDDVSIINNTITGGCVGQPAIVLRAETGAPHADATISGNVISGVGSDGILVEAPWTDVVIDGNGITAAGGNGISIFDGSVLDVMGRFDITGNVINGVQDTGISIQGFDIAVSGNKITAAPTGIKMAPGSGSSLQTLYNGKDMVVSRNAIRSGTDVGISMETPLYSYDTGNTIVNNTVDSYVVGMDIAKSNNQVAVYNNLLSNNTTGIALGTTGSGAGAITFTFNGFDTNTTNNTGFTPVAHRDVDYNIIDSANYVSTDIGSVDFLRLGASSLFIDAGSLDGVNPDPAPDAGDDIDMGWIESGVSAVECWRLF
jgi:Right handed beta helix region